MFATNPQATNSIFLFVTDSRPLSSLARGDRSCRVLHFQSSTSTSKVGRLLQQNSHMSELVAGGGELKASR
jgi:hypothetical protein